jgi:Na+-transporting NADH:ubiquinone oxidoreductase subunit C
MQRSVRYTILFAAAVCLVCSVLVSTVSVSLRQRQEANKRLLGQGRHLLRIAGLIKEGEQVSAGEIAHLMFTRLQARLVNLQTGEYAAGGPDPVSYDQRRAASDPETSLEVPDNPAQVKRVPKLAKIFLRQDGDAIGSIILPIEGKGLWSTLYGYIALAPDARTIQGISFYEQGETPGLGDFIQDPSWTALWKGRLAYDDSWEPKIAVAKGKVGPPSQDPYQVDGISGSTLTCNGVTHAVQFWLGDHGFGPFLQKVRERRGSE